MVQCTGAGEAAPTISTRRPLSPSATPRFGVASCAVFGYVLVLFLIILCLGPKLLSPPQPLGTYWAYTFPLAACASTGVGHALTRQSQPARVLAWSLIVVASTALSLVFLRMSIFLVACCLGRARPADPLVAAWRRQQRTLQAIAGMDTDGDGLISRAEFLTAVHKSGYPNASQADVNEVALGHASHLPTHVCPLPTLFYPHVRRAAWRAMYATCWRVMYPKVMQLPTAAHAAQSFSKASPKPLTAAHAAHSRSQSLTVAHGRSRLLTVAQGRSRSLTVAHTLAQSLCARVARGSYLISWMSTGTAASM